MTGFALMMKGRADDRRLFERGVKLSVMALQDGTEFDAEGLAKEVELSDYGLKPGDLTELKRLFEHATTFGSLIQAPEGLAEKLTALKQLSEATSQDLFVSEALKRLGPLVQQAELLAAQYDAVVANPPYMGSGGMNAPLKKFAKGNYPDAKSDLFACFMERGSILAKAAGHNAMVTMQSWMFLSSFEKMRDRLLREKTISTMAHLGARAFGSISGEVVQTTVTVLRNQSLASYRPVFFRLLDGGENEKRTMLQNNANRFEAVSQDEFKAIPGSPVAYWISEPVFKAFSSPLALSHFVTMRKGMVTADNDRFIRQWPEIPIDRLGVGCSSRRDAEETGCRWFPYTKGGSFRKWYGNLEFVVDWKDDGQTLRTLRHHTDDRVAATNFNLEYIFTESAVYSSITSAQFSLRYTPVGCLFDQKGAPVLPNGREKGDLPFTVGALNSSVASAFLPALCPTLDFNSGSLTNVPVPEDIEVASLAERTAKPVQLAKADWNAYERSWDFQSLPLLTASSAPSLTLESSYTAWITQNRDTIAEMKRLEEENNRLFIDAYGLADELTEEEQWTRFRQDTMEELVSYAIGCMMGRYSLDAPGLIYAHSGNHRFWDIYHETHERHEKDQIGVFSYVSCIPWSKFPPDDDGIIPITDDDWFPDDAANRVEAFIATAWPKEHLDENLKFIADSLGPNRNEQPRETIRRYLATGFYKHHLSMYKRRPIYWLFSSGKQRAFQCLVYLHRYNEGTLSRMRTEYVIPLQGKISSRIGQLDDDITAATSTSHRKRLEKERDKLLKQQAELHTFDEKLRHYADRRISLDLDDGVKVNYGEFGDLLAEVKAVTGRTDGP